MSFTVICYTLFDITQTGISARAKPNDNEDIQNWVHKRNSQCNFDTLLQVISLRSQPEEITIPNKKMIRFNLFDKFGFLYYQYEDEEYPCWNFSFEISHPDVFYDGISELGNLYRDCHDVPMIKCGTEWNKLPAFLDSSVELRNIYFEVKNK